MKKKIFSILFALLLCLSLVGMTFALSAPARAIDTGSISGCVSATATGDPIVGAKVVIFDRDTLGTPNPLRYPTEGFFETDTDGSYTATGLPPGEYVVVAVADLYAVEWYTYDDRDAYSWQEADSVSVEASQDITGIDFTLEPGSCISGHVYSDGEPIKEARIRVFDYASLLSGTWLSRGAAWTDDQGYYKTGGLITGTYAVQVTADGYATEWYTHDDRDAYSWKEADSVEVKVPGDTTGIDFTLEKTGSISGYIDDGVLPIADCHVQAFDSETYQWTAGTNTDEYGNYTLNCPEGSYAVRACASCSDLSYVDEYYNEEYEDTYRREEATPVTVEVDKDHPGINFTLEIGGFISGQVTYLDDGESIPIFNCHVYASDSVANEWTAGSNTDEYGNYTLNCPLGSYVVRACATCSRLNYVNEYWENKYSWDKATPLEIVEVDDHISDINFSLEVTVPRETIEDAIDDGIAWLAAQQKGDGSWGTDYPLAKTAFAVLKLESHATASDPPLSPFDDAYPYKAQVEDGLDYIFANAHIIDIGMQSAGNPDGDADGKGVYFHSPVEGKSIYETSQVMMAIVASNAPGRFVAVDGSAVNGQTYHDVLQDVVDYIAWAQTDFGFGRGGWNYEAMDNTGERSDQSNSGYVTLGLAYAEAFGIIIPGFVRSELNIWIDYIQDDVNGGSWYSGPDDPWEPQPEINTLKTGNLLQQMEFFGDSEDADRVQAAIDYLVRNWNPNVNCFQTTYTIMKGLEAFNIDMIGDIDWFGDFTDAILGQQTADGWWPHSHWDDEEAILSTEWALLTLQMVTPPPGIDWIEIDLMKILFDRNPNCDKMEIKGRFQLEEGARYNLAEDTVTVTIDGVVITIPPGSFVGSAGKYEYKLEGEPKVGMKLDFNNGEWSLKVGHIDASPVDSNDGVPVVDVTVTLMIGYMVAGQDVPTWCNDLVYP